MYLFENYPGFDSLNVMMDSLTTAMTGSGGGDVAVDGLLSEMTLASELDLDQILTNSSSDFAVIMNGIV